MIDIHSHFLFGIDDGSKNRSQTINMLHQAVDVGITDLVATPHINETSNKLYFEQVQKNFLEVQEIIINEGIKLKIHSGSEIILDSQLKQWCEREDLLIGKENKYLLFELPLFFDFLSVRFYKALRQFLYSFCFDFAKICSYTLKDGLFCPPTAV